jgi:hypothetical protein
MHPFTQDQNEVKRQYGQGMLSRAGCLALSALIAFLGAAIWYAVKV